VSRSQSKSPPKHAAPNPNASLKSIRTVRFWSVPIVVTLALMSALAGLYLGGILNPTTNLRHFPIALVNEDAGPTGAQIVQGLRTNLDQNRYDFRVVGHEEAKQMLDRAQAYGELVIPPTFSTNVREYGLSAVTAAPATRPSVTIATNPRAGTLAAGIAGTTLTQAMAEVNKAVGQRLTAEVNAQTGGAPMTGASALAITNPIDVKSTVFNPLPNGTGNGLSAFYYSLLLLLAGFTGSIVVSTLVDSMLGYVPAEWGPVYRFAEQINISRFRTLLIKWAMMGLLALLASGVYMAIAHSLGMPIQHPWPLWLFGVFAITAVGVTSSSLIAILGSMGLLFSMLIFVILGLPSAGATVPLEAVPPLFHWLSTFEPMHQVFLGVRSLLYLDGHGDAGLTQALVMTSIGLVIGLLVGGLTTRLYDRSGFHRIPGAVEMAIAEAHQMQHKSRVAKGSAAQADSAADGDIVDYDEEAPIEAPESTETVRPAGDTSESPSGQT
jgi:YhgE/Pip-like protein